MEDKKRYHHHAGKWKVGWTGEHQKKEGGMENKESGMELDKAKCKRHEVFTYWFIASRVRCI